jgi:hypothetical protein
MLEHELVPDPSPAPEALDELFTQVRELQSQAPAPMLAPGMCDGTGEDEFVFIRGNHKNPGERVPRRIIEALAGEAPPQFDAQAGSGRLTLADQIAHADSPLTSRVLVNRVWHHLFGQGLIPSTDNFGVLGEPPTHPELLDYLAIEWVRDGWSIKRLIRRLMLSQTYRMSSRPRLGQDVIDPQNKWLHHARVRRLEGEAIRDTLLAVAGDLDLRMFGPGVPVYLTEFMQGRGRPDRSGPLNGDGRRSVYLEVRRNFLVPMLLAFDMPIPFNTMGRRNVSNVPAQSLILLNDPLVVHQARRLAARVMQEEPGAAERIDRIYRLALSRPPTRAESELAAEFIQAQRQLYIRDGREAEAPDSEQRVWGDLCHVVFNLKEFIFLN